jgi:hypothetical protein
MTHDYKRHGTTTLFAAGNVSAGVGIGEIIHQRSFHTAVLNYGKCLSACAIAWLGGAKRYIGDRADVGFHTPFVRNKVKVSETLTIWTTETTTSARDIVADYVMHMPITAVSNCIKVRVQQSAYSISPSARASSPGGTTVFKLIASSNFVGRNTGISAGDAAFRIRPRTQASAVRRRSNGLGAPLTRLKASDPRPGRSPAHLPRAVRVGTWHSQPFRSHPDAC